MQEEDTRKHMDRVIEVLVGDMGTVRSGRVTPALVENLQIHAYGGTQRLTVREMGNITVQDAQTLLIEPWDKSVLGEIKKGIEAANVGMNPTIDRELIRISMPPLTTEDRDKYVKLLLAKLENARISIRQVRASGMQDIKKLRDGGNISEDEQRSQEKKLQSITNEYMDKIEKLGDAKIAELRVQ